ncbi:GMC family oxidoreductase [Demequina activiva]|uniref:2-keto-gluconate dehydrogenase n=1 Tax=Demequina activiva TaxID=1582364 RepID=A0A919Q6B7_9MICO|nr:GMC family oxidoreductase [Demequina activiva]GIG55038.1 2-keto-gluconate dehydrogenase [Demequina activiva]
MTGVDNDALAAWAAAVIPAGGLNGSGTVSRVAGILASDHPEWQERFAALDRRASPDHPRLFDTDPDAQWLARLIAQVHVSHPGTWREIGWRESHAAIPEGSDLPDELVASLIERPQLEAHYDAIVIGSGAGGGVAAQEYAEAGRRVLVIERGDAPVTDALARDHLRNPRADAMLDVRTGPPIAGNPRIGADGTTYDPSHPRWGNNAMTLGGGTRVYGGQAWRFSPQDFAMASTYGVPHGSALADWPVTYEDMEPYYAHAEFEWGVSGAPGDPATEGARSGPFPLPPMPRTAAAHRLRAGADSLGWRTLHVPLLINSEPYRGRAACVRCAQCVGFACPVGAKAGSQNTTLFRAARTGRLAVITGAQAVRLLANRDGRITGVLLRGRDTEGPWEATVEAEEFALAAGAVETARLLLASPTSREPDGIGNDHDQVGRHLQAHVYAGAVGVFDDPVEDGQGPGPAIATNDFRHGNPGLVGGGMLANDFVPTPASALSCLQDAGLLSRAGAGVVDGLSDLMPRLQRVVGPVHEVTTADARVTVDTRVTDAAGMPVVRFTGDVHPEDLRVQSFLSDRAEEWLRASGAREVVRLGARGHGEGPSVGQHQAGTCRMGTEPASSVLDPWGRVWGHANLRVVDGSAHVTNGGVNPVLTIIANAYRIMDAAVSEAAGDYAG